MFNYDVCRLIEKSPVSIAVTDSCYGSTAAAAGVPNDCSPKTPVVFTNPVSASIIGKQ